MKRRKGRTRDPGYQRPNLDNEDYGDIEITLKSKYFGEILTPNFNETAAIEEKYERRKYYEEKRWTNLLSHQPKFRHNSTVVTPKCRYASQTTAL